MGPNLESIEIFTGSREVGEEIPELQQLFAEQGGSLKRIHPSFDDDWSALTATIIASYPSLQMLYLIGSISL